MQISQTSLTQFQSLIFLYLITQIIPWHYNKYSLSKKYLNMRQSSSHINNMNQTNFIKYLFYHFLEKNNTKCHKNPPILFMNKQLKKCVRTYSLSEILKFDIATDIIIPSAYTWWTYIWCLMYSLSNASSTGYTCTPVPSS